MGNDGKRRWEDEKMRRWSRSLSVFRNTAWCVMFLRRSLLVAWRHEWQLDMPRGDQPTEDVSGPEQCSLVIRMLCSDCMVCHVIGMLCSDWLVRTSSEDSQAMLSSDFCCWGKNTKRYDFTTINPKSTIQRSFLNKSPMPTGMENNTCKNGAQNSQTKT